MKLFVLLVCAAGLGAADLSGKWTGTSQFVNRDGQTRSGGMLMILSQKGEAVTGTAGPGAERQQEIRNGKVAGATLTFEIVDTAGSAVVELTIAGDTMKGEARMKREYGVITMKLDLRRE